MLIGISGFARSGKDTVCEILKHHGLINERYAFADPIKLITNRFFGWGDEHAFGDLKETDETITHVDSDAFMWAMTDFRLDRLGRTRVEIYDRFLEAMGWVSEEDNLFDLPQVTSPRKVYQIFGTEVGRDFIDKNVWVKIAPTTDVAIPDVRFPNEAEWVKANGGIVIRVVNDRAVSVNMHASEQHIDSLPADHVIDNNGTLYDLETRLITIFGLDDKNRLHSI